MLLKWLWLVITSFLSLMPCLHGRQHRLQSVYQRISQEKDLSTFYNLLQANRQAKPNILYSEVTVFVPTNAAFDKYCGNVTNETLMYHIVYGAKMLSQLEDRPLKTTLENAPPLWITTSNNYAFVNNAEIIIDRSNYFAKNRNDDNGKEQVFHIIDEVLDPHVHGVETSAKDFIDNYKNWDIGSYSLEKFRKKTMDLRLGNLFKQSGNYTFLIPVDPNIYDIKYNMLDDVAIRGHIVPNFTLFTKSAPKLFPFETLANTDPMFVVFMMLEEDGEFFVKSNTLYGDVSHQSGTVMAKILKANIPLSNGVAHLISRPLVVMENLKKKFPFAPMYYKLSADPSLNITYLMAERAGFLDILKTGSNSYTLFLPSDKAWKRIEDRTNGISKIFRKSFEDTAFDILKRHLIVERESYSMQFLAEATSNDSKLMLNSMAGPIQLGVHQIDKKYFIDWKNKHITVTRPDYECTNGMIHIIDDVFLTDDEVSQHFGDKNSILLHLAYGLYTSTLNMNN